ncbi:MAG: type I 3-dehydroquinate dehydratase [Phycisphaerae bacterium]|nr:type I 3-dehydroquinate dehydratase [Phycisphaerae bacterium]
MTLLAAPVFGNSIEQIRRDREAAVKHGADLIELRIDLMEGVSDDDIRSLRNSRGLPIILTIRSAAEGGRWPGDDDERIGRLIALGPFVDYIDVELATYQRSADIRQKIGLALKCAGYVSQAGGKEENVHPGKRKLILSRHDLTSRPPTLQADFVAMLDEPACHVPKLVWRGRTIRDNFEAFDLMRESPRPAIVICMGEEGLLSRVLARKFGAFATFAAVAAGSETAAGQASIADMKELYRWDAIDGDTRVYGVIGDPVGHSISPRVHNAAFAATGENAVYLPMRVGPSYESFKAFMSEVLARPWLDFRGFSVTIPHKENAVRYLREAGGTIDPLAERLGAVNTLSLTTDGRLTGHNTDCAAAIDAIAAGLRTSRAKPRDAEASAAGAPGLGRGVAERPVGSRPFEEHPPAKAGGSRDGVQMESALSGLGVAVLGAGGAARAIVAGLAEAGAHVTIFNRTEDKARALAETFGCRHLPWPQRVKADATLVVNCTSVGLWPAVNASPLPATALRPGMTVFDTIYNPLRTRLLREADDCGCATIDGLTMFALQARAQFEIWTGRRLPAETIRQVAVKAVGGQQSAISE